MGADAYVITDFVQLSNDNSMAGTEICADAIAGIDHAMGADDCILADDRLQFARLRIPRRYADDYKFIDEMVCA